MYLAPVQHITFFEKCQSFFLFKALCSLQDLLRFGTVILLRISLHRIVVVVVYDDIVGIIVVVLPRHLTKTRKTHTSVDISRFVRCCILGIQYFRYFSSE